MFFLSCGEKKERNISSFDLGDYPGAKLELEVKVPGLFTTNCYDYKEVRSHENYNQVGRFNYRNDYMMDSILNKTGIYKKTTFSHFMNFFSKISLPKKPGWFLDEPEDEDLEFFRLKSSFIIRNKKAKEIFYVFSPVYDDSLYAKINDSVSLAKIQRRDDSVATVNDQLKDSLYGYYFANGLFIVTERHETNARMVGSTKGEPYDTASFRNSDTITYSFRLSNLSGFKYYGRYFTKPDTLVLFYTFDGRHGESYSDYTLTYKIPLKNNNRIKNKHLVYRSDKTSLIWLYYRWP